MTLTTHAIEHWTREELISLVNSLTRRRVISAAAAATLLSQVDGWAQGTPIPEGFRELVDAMGPVLVPENPQRVIADNNTTLGNMLALGVTPVGASVNMFSLPDYLSGHTEGVEDVTGENGINLEKALALDPDLIVAIWGSDGSGWAEENCARYKEAVATYAYEQNYVYEEDLIDNLRKTAIALNIETEADAVVAGWNTRVEELAGQISDAGFEDKPITVVRIWRDGTYSIPVGTSESIAFRAVGIPQPEGQQNPEDFSVELSLENLNLLNEAWAVVVYINDNADFTQEQVLDDELWQLLTPVQEGRVVFVSSGVWNSIDILGAHAILDDIENLILPLAANQ